MAQPREFSSTLASPKSLSPPGVTPDSIAPSTIKANTPRHSLKRRRSDVDLYETTTKISCSDKQIFEIHKGLFCHHSGYFQKAFENGTDEARRKLFSLSGEDSGIFVYIKAWLYGDKLYGEEGSDEKTEADDDGKVDGHGDESAFNGNDREMQAMSEDAHLLKYVEAQSSAAMLGMLPPESPSNPNGQMAISSTHRNDKQPSSAVKACSVALDTLTLTKIYATAEHLEMPALCDTVATLLAARLGYDMLFPLDALVYAYARAAADSPVRDLLVDFAARNASMDDMREQVEEAAYLPPLLLKDLLLAIGPLRRNLGGREGWERFRGLAEVLGLWKVKPKTA